MVNRTNARKANELRKIEIIRNYTNYAEGSVLVCFGDTKVICNASVVAGVPRWLKGSGNGWITGEYGMLPRATHDRVQRDAIRSGGRTHEIQRLIGRSLRAAVDMTKLGENTINVDCDVIQADGGTRTASITGGCIALYDAIQYLLAKKQIKVNPFNFLVASVSVGIWQGQLMLDLDYREDSTADTDMNVVMTEDGKFIEVQGTAEGKPYQREELYSMLELAQYGITELITCQRQVLGL